MPFSPRKRFHAAAVATATAAALLFPGADGPGAGQARAQEAAPRATTIKRVETYLNSIKTLRARFLQISPTGEVARGTVLISRPGKLRIEYDPPSPVLILTQGSYLMLFDKDLQSPSYAPLDDSLAGFLVRPEIRLSGDVQVRKLTQAKGVIRLSIVQTESPEAGTLTLVFNDGPLSLRQWVIVDAQGGETRVSLVNPQFNVEIDPSKFEFTLPEEEEFDRE
ncbi:MAG: outer membrane lipoprotein carrier protein LolA [Alphaproteobacteria bacterium]|nr:outer membrane lipoprotein carrier protein LolA [Alphaproteobacteria bacterium]